MLQQWFGPPLNSYSRVIPQRRCRFGFYTEHSVIEIDDVCNWRWLADYRVIIHTAALTDN
jgi:hypothetical protein